MHPDRGGCKGVVRWEYERAPILAAFVGGLGWAGEDVVPFEDVALRGVGDDVGWGRLRHVGIFLCKALGCGGCRHDV